MTFTMPEPTEEPKPSSLADLTPPDPEPVVEADAQPDSAPATGSVPALDPAKTGRHLATQTEYPRRTAVFAGAVTFVGFLAAVASIIADEQVQYLINRYIPGQAAGVIGFGVFVGLLVGVLHRVANIPAVARLRTRLHFGPIPTKEANR